ncbi:MAG: NAD-dependent epimerase/dehydratase family protein [Chloroflexaceae bacterium]|nr:NAD-dependent epimerase/dehydratase family protein [Chloroflexaceae bacterium]
MKWIVTGGAGFIGCNISKALLDAGHEVVVLDNLSRRGTQENLDWLRPQGDMVFVQQDIRDFDGLRAAILSHADADVVLHLAAQVAVTTSVTNPREDFDINALGTFNLLEAVRQSGSNPIILYASTNKVYGKMENLGFELRDGRYQYTTLPEGVDEAAPLDFYSPYGCSKGAADQYVRDYARIYGMRTVVFRQSCIYGIRQFGIEDQGWVAWFIIAALLDGPITIYGDGRQVRDVLFIDDLVRCYLQAVEHIDRTNGEVYNIGGGPTNQMSLLELLALLETRHDQPTRPRYSDWRPGDQRVFVADIRKAAQDFGWRPQISIAAGIDCLCAWVRQEDKLIRSVLSDRLDYPSR